MTFANGWTISVQWGANTYSDNRNKDPFTALSPIPMDSTTAEIAIWNDVDHEMMDFGDDNVKGYCDANEVASWIERVSKF